MSRDAKNSILLWVATLAFFGVFWAFSHFGMAPNAPDGWQWPMFLLLVGVNVVRFAWGFFHKRPR